MSKKKKEDAENEKNVEEKIKNMLRVALDIEAYDRISNVKVANQELYVAAAQNVLAVYNRIERKINDDELKHILATIVSQKERRTSITFDRK
ncbi:MAG TPA: DNA-binding protein [Candidatus Bilamarchaeaceae archaeon]|nr:DNA-binding protein [Candidatus Bilamarchaeaceae archaeon]